MGKRKVKDEVKEEALVYDEEPAAEEVEEVPVKEKKKKKRVYEAEEPQTGEEKAAFKIKTESISFADASAIIKKNAKCGFKIVKERRHFSLPYHLMSTIRDAIEHLCRNQLNKYRAAVEGAVIAIDFKGIRLVSKPRVIDDQHCFHCTAITPLVVFSPERKQKFEATLTSVGSSFLTALIFNVITVNVDMDQATVKATKGMTLEMGDVISVECDSLQIKRGMCQMKGQFKSFVRKGTKQELDHLASLQVDHHTFKKSQSGLDEKKSKKSKRLDEVDEDSE